MVEKINRAGYELTALIWECETLKELYYLKNVFDSAIEKRADQLQILEFIKEGRYVKE